VIVESAASGAKSARDISVKFAPRHLVLRYVPNMQVLPFSCEETGVPSRFQLGLVSVSPKSVPCRLCSVCGEQIIDGDLPNAVHADECSWQFGECCCWATAWPHSRVVCICQARLCVVNSLTPLQRGGFVGFPPCRGPRQGSQGGAHAGEGPGSNPVGPGGAQPTGMSSGHGQQHARGAVARSALSLCSVRSVLSQVLCSRPLAATAPGAASSICVILCTMSCSSACASSALSV
jgi:hypothetical protein